MGPFSVLDRVLLSGSLFNRCAVEKCVAYTTRRILTVGLKLDCVGTSKRLSTPRVRAVDSDLQPLRCYNSRRMMQYCAASCHDCISSERVL